MVEEQKKAQENTLRVATNLAVLLSDKDVLVPTKYAMAIVEAQQLINAMIADLKKVVDDSKIVEAEVVK